MSPRSLKQMVKSSALYPFAQAALEDIRGRRELRAWTAAGGIGNPPHRLKQSILRGYAKRYELTTLVETGTYLGAMVYALRNDFARIHTVEVDEALHTLARHRFARLVHVTTHRGDSAQVLPEILRSLSEPTLFWLDGHYSGGITSMGAKATPVVEEIAALMAHHDRRHVILIDDARCFGTSADYPQLDELRDMVAFARPDLDFEVEHDIIRLAPRA